MSDEETKNAFTLGNHAADIEALKNRQESQSEDIEDLKKIPSEIALLTAAVDSMKSVMVKANGSSKDPRKTPWRWVISKEAMAIVITALLGTGVFNGFSAPPGPSAKAVERLVDHKVGRLGKRIKSLVKAIKTLSRRKARKKKN